MNENNYPIVKIISLSNFGKDNAHMNYRERWSNICILKALSPSSRWVQITIDDICFDVLGSKFGYVQGLDHSEVINIFTQHNLYRDHYN